MYFFPDTQTMSYRELRFWFREWPIEWVNQLYIEMLEDEEQGYY